MPALIVPLFFFVVNVGALRNFAETSGAVPDFKAFQLPVAIIFAVTGISQAGALVTDIQDGYFDRLLMTPISRLALLLGLMVADLVLVISLSHPGARARVRHRRAVRDRRARGAGLHPARRGSGAWSSPASRTPSPSRPATPAR